jgi:predicted DNA-binding protein (MmcQ/YjbR family)
MDAESGLQFLSSLPHVVKTVSQTNRWGDKHVFRVGDRTIGGKMFCQIDFVDGRAILSFAASPERFRDLIERDGIIPAPYRALMQWNAIPDAELKDLLRATREITLAKLPRRTRDLLP